MGNQLQLGHLSGGLDSTLNQDEFRLERWRERIQLCLQVLLDLREMRIQYLDDRGRKLLGTPSAQVIEI
jgi:hypothetical protein